MSFRIFQPRAPIVSVEPNPFHEPDLRFTGRVVRRFTFRILAGGDRRETVSLYVPVFRGIPFTTEAALDRDAVCASSSLRARLGKAMDTDAFRVETVHVEVRPLDDLGLEPAFIKLDVQGHESAVLRGLSHTIDVATPVLMIESARTETHHELLERGYQALAYDAASATLRPARWPVTNVFYVHGRWNGPTARSRRPSGLGHTFGG